MISFWLGASTLLGLAVAPAAFAVLPSRELAGAVVGRVLPVIFWAGAAVGSISIALEVAGRRGGLGRTRVMGGAILLAACLAAQLVVGPRIADLRSSLRAPLASLAATDPQRVAFGRLHMQSVAWLGVAMAAGLVILASAATTLRRGQ